MLDHLEVIQHYLKTSLVIKIVILSNIRTYLLSSDYVVSSLHFCHHHRLYICSIYALVTGRSDIFVTGRRDSNASSKLGGLLTF